ncbi:MAG: dihydrofolate reductase family protein [Myxococcota bacterium]
MSASVGRVRVYIACSLDGFIAGEDDDLAWLDDRPEADVASAENAESLGFEAFMADVGALVMGRRTFEVVESFGPEAWLYGKRPVLVATHRPLSTNRSTVRPVDGAIEDIIAEARRMAAPKDVYLDGGQLIRAALDAGLIDELVVTVIPVVLGKGIPLFAGATKRHDFALRRQVAFPGGGVQLTLLPPTPPS